MKRCLLPCLLLLAANVQAETYTAGSLDQALKSLSAMDIRQDAVCMRLEGNLVALQAISPSLDGKAFEAANEELKKMHLSLCEKEEYDGDTLAYAEGRLGQLETALAYSEILVKKGRASRPQRGNKRDKIDHSSPRILTKFPAAHNACARGCGYISWGIWGDKAHQARKSCHNSGDAIDIHAIRCGGKVSPGGSARFEKYVSCMRGHLGVIYGNAQHQDHAHFQLRDCRKI